MSEENKNKIIDMEKSIASSMVISVKGEGDRVYTFSMPFNSPLPECYHAALNAAQEIARLYNEAISKEKGAAGEGEEGEEGEEVKGSEEEECEASCEEEEADSQEG